MTINISNFVQLNLKKSKGLQILNLKKLKVNSLAKILGRMTGMDRVMVAFAIPHLCSSKTW